MTTKISDTMSAQEYEALQSNELTNNDVKKMFLSRFKFEHRPPTGVYRPSVDAEHVIARPYLGYYINYSFPRYSDKPLASVWTTYVENGEERFKIFHVDLDKFTTLIIDEMLAHGFNPPPQKRKGYTKPVDEYEEDDKPY